NVITPEFKKAGDALILVKTPKDEKEIPDFDRLKGLYGAVFTLTSGKKVLSAYALGAKGVVEAAAKMGFGNCLGAALRGLSRDELLLPQYGGLLLEVSKEDCESVLSLLSGFAETRFVGEVTAEPVVLADGNATPLADLKAAYDGTLSRVFPTKAKSKDASAPSVLYDAKRIFTAKEKVARPTVFVPVFPGTNCEYDVAAAFKRAGADVVSEVFANLNESMIKDSVERFVKAIEASQMIMFPGGFSAGDEPDGSGKFIANVFRNSRISDAVNDLLKKRDGLVLGICNGFQAVIKLGLVPYGEICPQKEDSPTLATNAIGRHMSKSVYTKLVSNNSPWLQGIELGSVRAIPASHGEGRFVATNEWLEKLKANGQIATQYVDPLGNPSMDEAFNPNGSYWAIEGIISPDGRVLGKMAHSERIGEDVAVNIYGDQDQKIFESGVKYFL
ncbi:MAG: phosphoribosylformylglycinamidine synthase subunit PurQ, partial [Lachnospiraceae bacterium]|nr:phosphoribosylformylglycinamidine synthase subunit PurQ [Lachnospiraceae bacterium]